MAPITTPLHRLPGVYRQILLLLRRLIAHPEFQPGLWSGSLSEEFCYSQYLVFCLYVVKRRNEEPTTLPVSMFLRPLHLKLILSAVILNNGSTNLVGSILCTHRVHEFGSCRDLHPGPVSLLHWSGSGKPWLRLDSKQSCPFGYKDRELSESQAEIKELRLSERLREKAVEENKIMETIYGPSPPLRHHEDIQIQRSFYKAIPEACVQCS
ncbi:hypothetical protein LXL04_036624 [Taraxacum kok-saghyz]